MSPSRMTMMEKMSCCKLIIYMLSFEYLLSAAVPQPQWSLMSMNLSWMTTMEYGKVTKPLPSVTS